MRATEDQWEAEDCESGFNFPDDEGLIQAEFEKNIPFALAVAESAKDPNDPVSVVGRDAEDFRVDSFAVSYGDPQTVAVWAKRDLLAEGHDLPHQRRPLRISPAKEWEGGERYGDENVDYYAEYRGTVEGYEAGRQRRGRGSPARPSARDILEEPRAEEDRERALLL